MPGSRIGNDADGLDDREHRRGNRGRNAPISAARLAELDLCAEVRPGDGDPTQFFRREGRRENANDDHRDERFCSAVRRALNDALAETGDTKLSALEVVSVERTAKGASCLLVTVSPRLESDAAPPAQVTEGLAQAKGFLLSYLARWLNPKKMPDLRFQVLAQPVDFDAAHKFVEE